MRTRWLGLRCMHSASADDGASASASAKFGECHSDGHACSTPVKHADAKNYDWRFGFLMNRNCAATCDPATALTLFWLFFIPRRRGAPKCIWLMCQKGSVSELCGTVDRRMTLAGRVIHDLSGASDSPPCAAEKATLYAAHPMPSCWIFIWRGAGSCEYVERGQRQCKSARQSRR